MMTLIVRLRKTSARRLSDMAVQPVSASNDIPDSTSGKEKEGNQESMGR